MGGIRDICFANFAPAGTLRLSSLIKTTPEEAGVDETRFKQVLYHNALLAVSQNLVIAGSPHRILPISNYLVSASYALGIALQLAPEEATKRALSDEFVYTPDELNHIEKQEAQDFNTPAFCVEQVRGVTERETNMAVYEL